MNSFCSFIGISIEDVNIRITLKIGKVILTPDYIIIRDLHCDYITCLLNNWRHLPTL